MGFKTFESTAALSIVHHPHSADALNIAMADARATGAQAREVLVHATNLCTRQAMVSKVQRNNQAKGYLIW